MPTIARAWITREVFNEADAAARRNVLRPTQASSQCQCRSTHRQSRADQRFPQRHGSPRNRLPTSPSGRISRVLLERSRKDQEESARAQGNHRQHDQSAQQQKRLADRKATHEEGITDPAGFIRFLRRLLLTVMRTTGIATHFRTGKPACALGIAGNPRNEHNDGSKAAHE